MILSQDTYPFRGMQGCSVRGFRTVLSCLDLYIPLNECSMFNPLDLEFTITSPIQQMLYMFIKIL